MAVVARASEWCWQQHGDWGTERAVIEAYSWECGGRELPQDETPAEYDDLSSTCVANPGGRYSDGIDEQSGMLGRGTQAEVDDHLIRPCLLR
jgi:hypothetical protein